jgi:hypothetical protein
VVNAELVESRDGNHDGNHVEHANPQALVSAASPAAPAPVDPDEMLRDPGRAMLRAAGADPVELVRHAVEVLEAAMAGEDLDTALRATDQVWRIVGAQGKNAGSGGPSVTVPIQINLPDWAKPAERKTSTD